LSHLSSSRKNDAVLQSANCNNQITKTISSNGNFSSIDDNEAEDNIQQEQSDYQDRRESQSEMKDH
jgi:hypothetical protein